MISILTSLIENITWLLDVLKEERILLEKNQEEALKVLLEKKDPLLKTIESLSESYKAELGNRGFSSDPTGLKAYIESFPPKEKSVLEEKLAQLRYLTALFEKKNNTNGTIVFLSQKNHSRMLDILFKRTATLTYDELAKTNRGLSKRTLNRV